MELTWDGDPELRRPNSCLLLRLFKLHPSETCSRMRESWGGEHGMQDALPPPGFVSSVPSMPSRWCMLGNKEHSCSRSQVEATGRLSEEQPQPTTFQRKLPPPPAAHTPQRGIHDVLPVGSGRGTGLTSRPATQPRQGPQTPTHGWSTVYPVYTAHAQPWESRTCFCYFWGLDAANYKVRAALTKKKARTPTPVSTF